MQCWILTGLCILLRLTNAEAATNTDAAGAPISLSKQEAAGCSNNLVQIYKAIQAYKLANRDLPNWLSDLVPKYLSDPNLLTCPVCRRTGRVESPPLADPRISSSYLFEFCPVPLGNMLPNAPERTRREWKRRQMGIVGSAVPMVRCRHHEGNSLNLTFDGKVYPSYGQWELAFTNQVKLEDLNPPALFAGEPKSRFPGRDPNARPQLINLSAFYNVALEEAWQGQTNGSLSALRKGLQKLGGTEFDIRGMVQLGGRGMTNKPSQIKNIPINLTCKRLHFLHAAATGTAADEGKQIGSYFVHFSNNPARLEIPIVYGKDLRNWRPAGNEGGAEKGLPPAWSGESSGRPVRLYKMTWANLAPETTISEIEFVSSVSGAAPFLIAVTAE